jgi:RimJ/RimL family protein N-acetyltransferase
LNDQNLGPCTLEGRFVRLEPLREEHADALFEAGRNLDWGWMLGPLRTKESVDLRIAEGLERERRNEEYGLVVVLKKNGRVIGSTAYLSIVAKHKRLEVGSTWYSPEYWGTVVNPECKYLLLKHAFEDWGAVRIQLGTDVNNVRSQRAILKLGAKLEGRLRNHGIRPDGSVRDALLYSIVASEWPEVKSRLHARIKSLQAP